MAPVETIKRPSGWKVGPEGGSLYWVKYTRFGVRYMCRSCGLAGESGRHVHRSTCPRKMKGDNGNAN